MFSSPFFSAIPANKFYPPRIASGQTLQRSRLVESCLQSQYQFVIIEAQAGQGKTTTAIQLIESGDAPYLWFQVGVEDCDPIIFLASVLAGIKKRFPEFSSATAESQLVHGQAQIPELINVLNLILRDLDRWLSGTLVLVFDDVHLLEQAPHTMALLDHLLETVPPDFSIMLLSRRAVDLKSKRVRFGGSTRYLTNEDLALTRDEGVELLSLFLTEDVDSDAKMKMIDYSAGWPMGLVLTAQNYLQGGDGSLQARPSTESYFEDELLGSLAEDEQQMVLKLALLEEISIDLAGLICPDVDVLGFLRGLTRKNFFLRLLDDDGTVFGFHHHFLAFLRKRGALEFAQDERVRIWNIAAHGYTEKGMIGRGMSLYLKAMNIKELQNLFSTHGHGMLARNRHVTLGGVLAKVPADVLGNSGVLSYYYGLILQLSEPDRSLAFLKQSRLLFNKAGDQQGELLAASGILYLYIIHSQRLPRSQAIFPQEVHQLFQEAGHLLPDFQRIATANHIALGFVFFIDDFKQAAFYNDLAADLAEKKQLVALQIESRIASGWIYILSGDYKSGSYVVEQNYPLICKREVGLACRVQLYMLQLNHLLQRSEYDNFEQQKNEYYARVGYDVLKQSFVYPFMVLWEIELLFSQGKLAEAIHQIDSHLHTDKFSNQGNYRGELLGWRTLCLVCGQGDDDALQSDLAEITAWLDGGASPLHNVKAMMLLGNMHRVWGQPDQALDYLNRGVQMAKKFGLEKFLGCCLLHRALVFFTMEEEDKAHGDLQSGLELFKDKLGCSHVFALAPDMLQELLQRGIGASVFPQFCQRYGLQQLGMVLSAKTAVPELHIQVLGGLQLSLPGGEESGTATTFIKGQRRLLGLLLRSESLEVSQAVVQDELWPDVPEDKARGRFDTLMARLRKVLKPIVHPHAVKNYVAVSKGVVALNHCRVDSYQFCRLVEEGLVHLKNGEFWQAGNSFYPALRLWQGAVALELLDLGEGGRFAEEPGRRLLEMVLQWCPVLFGIDRHDEALRVCVLAWQFNHENSEMARLLYGLYVQSGFTTKARQTLDEFEKALESLGVGAEKRHQLRAEIEDVLP